MNELDSQNLSPATRLGFVHLTVSDLKRSLPFYQDIVGLRPLGETGQTVSLGAGNHEILRITEIAGAQHAQGTTGLYHFAILTPGRPALGQALRRIAQSKIALGASDHLVSEALYISDPDGNGIEIYRDRPRAQWPTRDGAIQMAVDPLDLRSLLAEAGDESQAGLPDGTVLGHMHLHVSRLEEADAFYVGALGFDRMLAWGGHVSFVSAGGYHHHLGLNTWAGVGAPPPPPDAVGLRYFTIDLPDRAELEKTSERLRMEGYTLMPQEDGLLMRDPSQNGLLLRAAV